MTEHATTSRGDTVAYDRYGEGPGLVFVAGAGPFRAMDPGTTATARLAAEAGLTTVVFDRLGRGESGADGRLDLDRELEAVRALIDVAGGHAVLCGHSSGCSVSLAAAAAGLPVDGLVLWEAPLSAPAGPTTEWADEFERRLDAGELEAAQEWYMKDMPPEWLAGAKASPAWSAIYASAPTLRADAQSLRRVTAGLESGEPARPGARACARGVRDLHLPRHAGGGRTRAVRAAADRGPRGPRRRPHVGDGDDGSGPGRVRAVLLSPTRSLTRPSPEPRPSGAQGTSGAQKTLFGS